MARLHWLCSPLAMEEPHSLRRQFVAPAPFARPLAMADATPSPGPAPRKIVIKWNAETTVTVKIHHGPTAPTRQGRSRVIPTKPQVRSLAFLLLWLCLPAGAAAQSPAMVSPPPPPAATIVLPASVPDPLEPLNRVFWAFNRGFMTEIVKPTAYVYRAVIPKPARTGVGNFGRNLTFPGRLINNLLQQKWAGAGDESYRFLCNTTVGVAGFWDVATRWNIPKSDADFGQTFGQWGWQPACFLMLPIFGPSNERDTVGLAADTAANPLLYIAPYKFVADDPLSWLGPYSYFSYAVMYNDLADSVNEYVRFAQAEPDPYSEIQYAWTFDRANRVANYHVKGKPDPAALETIQSVFFTYQDPNFPNHARTRSVLIPATGRHLKFTYWLQPTNAPVVYIIPGLGAHRLAETALALAELAYKRGYTAVTLSSPFNPEFMEAAATAALPAYLPADGQDLHVALTEIDRHLRHEYPGRLRQAALMGYSMGAFDALYIASSEPTNRSSLIKFDRYVAISTPVRLFQGVKKLDEFYDAPLAWPAAERTADIENTFLKVAALSKGTLTPRTTLPFDAVESQFLIGLNFRLALRDIIYSSQRRHNQGILHEPLWDFRREPAYQEIMRYSYDDYFKKFAVPCYQAQGLAEPVGATLESAGDLRQYEDGLRSNPNIRVIVNENDFLLTGPDLAWLRSTFNAPQQLTVFPQGGHLGNLINTNVQAIIAQALAGLQ